MIRAGQDASGGYVASPTFSPVRGSRWLRDGSFIADAMSRVGEVESAEAFFDWVARIVESGKGFDARYTLAGERDSSDVAAPPARRLGALALGDAGARPAPRRRRPLGAQAARADGGATSSASGDEPCVDWWEEREGVHAATLACIAAGLGDELDLSPADERLDGSLLVLPFLGFGAVDVSPLVSARAAASTGISTTSTTAAASGCC